jgi:predicted phage gp36 major capsid-like protein
MDAAKAEKRDLTAAEDEKFDRIFAEIDELRTKIDAAEKSESRNAKLDGEKRWAEQSAGRRTAATDPNAAPPTAGGKRVAFNETDEYRSAYDRYLRTGLRGLGGDEVRALQADNDISGGFIVAPQQMSAQPDQVQGQPRVHARPGDDRDRDRRRQPGRPVARHRPGRLDLDGRDRDGFGRFEHGVRQAGAVPQAPGQADQGLPHAARPVHEAGGAAGPRAPRVQAGGHRGAGVPDRHRRRPAAGRVHRVALGISTGRDVSTDNTTTNLTGDGLINAKFSLKAPYMASPSLRWIFHRLVVRNIRKLKDGNGQYLWAAGLTGKPDTILEVPYVMSEYAPSTFTTGLYVGIIGDFSFYWIADSLNLQIQRLDELYAETNQVGFIGRSETDGMPVLEEAFARVKLA